MGATRLQKCGNELEAKKAMVSPSSDQLKLLKEVEQEDNVESLLGELDPASFAACIVEELKRSKVSSAEAVEDCQVLLRPLFAALVKVLHSPEPSNPETTHEPFQLDLQEISALDHKLKLCVTVCEVLKTVWTTLASSNALSKKVKDDDAPAKPRKKTDAVSSTLHCDVRKVTNFLHDHWLRTEQKELQLACGRVFQFLSDFVPSERPYYGTAYVLYLLLKINDAQNGFLQGDVARLLKCRDILTLIDFDDFAAQSLRGHLLNCCLLTKLYMSDVGQKFLSFILGSLHPQLTEMASQALRDWIPWLRSATGILQALSNVLHNAWRMSDEAIRLVLERTVEEFVELAILCEPKIAAKFREALLRFYRKNDSASSEFVCRSFPALVYRYVPVACWKVRFNATALFSVVFPLVDVSLPMAEYEADVERQYATLVKLTEDSHPEVRRVAVQGVCRVLLSYWEMVPVDKATILLNALLTKAVKDKASPAVRAAVLEGLVSVLSNPMSHTALNALLPKLADCLHDTSPLVRRSMASLLKRITEAKGLIDVTAIVPIEDIFSRLVKDYTLANLEWSTTLLRRNVSVDCLFSDALEVKRQALSKMSTGSCSLDCYQTALTLSELMYPSVFGVADASLPKQVERILLMAEKFPLALLCIVDLTAHHLPHLDCARLAVAILRFAARKCQDAMTERAADDNNGANNSQRRLRKLDALTQVLLQTAQVLFREALRKIESREEKLVARGRAGGRKKRAAREVSKAAKASKTSDDDARVLKEFVSKSIDVPTFQLFLQDESPVQTNAVTLLLILEHSPILEAPWFCQRLITFVKKHLTLQAETKRSDSLMFSNPNAANVFLDALVTYPVAEPLHAKLIECMVKIPLERTLTQLQLMDQRDVRKRQTKKGVQLRRPDLTQCVTLLQKGLCSKRWASAIAAADNLIPTALLDSLLRNSVKVLGDVEGLEKSCDPVLWEFLPVLTEVVAKLYVQRCVKNPSWAASGNVMDDLLETLSALLVEWAQIVSCAPSQLSYTVAETVRTLLPCIGVWMTVYYSRKQEQEATGPTAKAHRPPGSTDIAQFISAFLRVSYAVSKMEDFSNTYVSKQANVEPGKHPLVYAELCFMSAARFAVMLLDDTDRFAPVQSLELLESVLLHLPSAAFLESAWPYFSSLPSIQRLIRTAWHSVMTFVHQLKAQLSAALQSSTSPADEKQRLEALLTLLERFSGLLPTDCSAAAAAALQRDNVVVTIPLPAHESASDTEMNGASFYSISNSPEIV